MITVSVVIQLCMERIIFTYYPLLIMAKANIETSTGLKIAIDGTADEIASIIAHVKSGNQPIKTRHSKAEKNSRRSKNSSTSLVSLIQQLKEEGFFDSPKKIMDVKDALAQQTHHYPLQSVSTALIRRVKNEELGRIKEGKTWAYVKR